MICAKCGASNPPESAFCGACGAPLTAPVGAANQGSAPLQDQPAPPPVAQEEPAAAADNEDMPTFHSMEPLPNNGTPASSVDEAPTVRTSDEQPNLSAENVPAAEQVAPHPADEQTVRPVSPTPNLANNVPQAQAPWPTPAPAPGYSSGVHYPPAGQPTPVYPSGALYPQFQQQASYPPQPTPGAYPPQTPLPYPPQTPLPGYASGIYPAQGQSAPNYPVQGQPSGVFPPTNEFPAGAYPTPYGMQSSQPSWGTPGVYPGQTPPREAKPSKLINPMPLWAFVASIVVVAALLLLLFFFAGSDWAAGAQTAGVVALIIAVLILIAFGVRAGLGMLVQTNPHRRAQVLSALLLTLLLIAVGAVGLTQQDGVHNLQARALEGQQKWQTAINEYESAGQGAPSSEDIARTYNEWGEQLERQGQIDSAIAKFDLVYTTYTQAPTGMAQAKNDAVAAYQSEAEQATQKQDYTSATKHYDALLAEPYCQNDHACQTQYGTADANVYYKLAEQKLSLQPPDYAAAVAAFNKLTTAFSSSPQSQSAHADYARALLGDGQNLRNTTCSSALPIYQQLSSQFSDTPEGQQATSALKQPVPVKGQFTSNIPGGNDVPEAALVQGIVPGMTSNQFYPLLATSPITGVNNDGTFLFKPIKQGNYFLVWGTINQTAGQEVFSVSQLYPANVGPLCTVDMGQINESFPKA